MNYVITGGVIKGDGYGKKLGFPTVNLQITQGNPVYDPVYEVPKDGVYAGMAVLDGREYRSGIVLGPRGKIEAHMLGYAGDAYEKEVTLTINKFLREYKKFDTEEELINQIKEDIKQC